MSDTAARESAVVDGVRKGLFIGGSWVASSGGKTFPVEDPSTGKVLCEVADATPDDAMKALDAAVAAQEGWAAHGTRERGEILRQRLPVDERPRRRSGSPDDARDGQAGSGVEERDRVRRRFLQMVRRAGGTHRGRLHGDGERPGTHDGPSTTRWSVRAHHSVELPDRDGDPQDRAGHSGRMHDGGEAGRSDASVDESRSPRSSTKPGSRRES